MSLKNDLHKLTPVQKHMLRMMVDFEYCAHAILKVQTTDAELTPFALNGPQRVVLKIIEEIKSQRLLRVLILKGRRMGMSTLVSGRFYQKTSFFPNMYAMQITHEPQATDFLFRMVKRFYDFSPASIRPETRSNNSTLLEFNTKDGKGLNSGFRVATSGKNDVGSGQLIHYLHLSECAKMDQSNLESLLTAVLQCVPKDGSVDTEIIYESTAKGIGGIFYDKFWGARYRYWVERLDKNGQPVIRQTVNEKADPSNIETSIFIPWFCFEKNRLTAPHGMVLTPDEQEILMRFNLDNDQMFWRRFTIANDCHNSVEIFCQEHPSTPEEAFLGTGNPVFDNVKLQGIKMGTKDPVARYICRTDSMTWDTAVTGELRVWEEAKAHKRYVIGVDVAEGLAIGDFSVAAVIDHSSGEQVAEWHGKCDPYDFARVVVALAKRYNNGFLAVECNHFGRSTIDAVHETGYRNMWVDEVPDPPRKPRKRWGWRTDRKTKPMIINSLIRDVNEDTHGIASGELIEEMLSYKRMDDGGTEADHGRHDDRVMAYAIAKYVSHKTALPRITGGAGGVSVTNKSLSRIRKLGWT